MAEEAESGSFFSRNKRFLFQKKMGYDTIELEVTRDTEKRYADRVKASNCAERKKRRTARNGRGAELHGMEDTPNCAEWKRYRTARNGRHVELRGMEDAPNCAERK